MRFPKGFPKPRHYFAMKRRGMLSSSPITIPKKQNYLNQKNEQELKIPWWGWLILLFILSGLLRLCGHI
jgi:hypothetical protein